MVEELIKVIVEIKTPITLFAFLAMILLVGMALKPDLFYKFIGTKLNGEHTFKIINKVIKYGFWSFMLLTGLSYSLDYLVHSSKSEAVLLAELQVQNIPEKKIEKVLAQYNEGILYEERQNFTKAIEKIQASIKEVPTLTAQRTLALLFEKSGEPEKAKELIESESLLMKVQEEGSVFDKLEMDDLYERVSGVHQSFSFDKNDPLNMIGEKKILPKGSRVSCNNIVDPDQIVELLPGRYVSDIEDQTGEFTYSYYRIQVKKGQKLTVKGKSTDKAVNIQLHVYNSNCVEKWYWYTTFPNRIISETFNPDRDQEYYLRISEGKYKNGNRYNLKGAVYLIYVE